MICGGVATNKGLFCATWYPDLEAEDAGGAKGAKVGGFGSREVEGPGSRGSRAGKLGGGSEGM